MAPCQYKDALLFVSARSPVELRSNLAKLCNPLVLNLPEWNQSEEIIRLAAVFRWLSENPGWLLISRQRLHAGSHS
jgi:hypothetical protein